MRAPRTRLLIGASGLVLAATGTGASPAWAQSAALVRAAAGLPSVAVPMPLVPRPAPAAVPTGGLGSASARAIRAQARVATALGLAAQAQAAAKASTGRLTVPNGLAAGGLVPVSNPMLSSLDPTGLHTWQGAAQPVQQTAGAATTVTVTQTDSRAVLSWQSFNVGKDTTLVFDQKANGVAQKDWVALNRVVGQLDPVTGRRDPNTAPAPSQILGRIKADGTVLVLNQAGVIFGAGAQVNTHSLVVSSLEIGRARALAGTTTTLLGIRQRDDEFLNFGLLGIADQASQAEKPQIFTFSAQAVSATEDDPLREGDIRVDAGASIATDAGGLILLTGPTVVNSGSLSAIEGQVSLQSGRRIRLTRSEGTATSADPNVRGLIVTSENRENDPIDYVWNTEDAIIESRRGYLSLGATASGATLDDGVLSATTSVSRNGFVDLTGGSIRLGQGATIAISPDDGAETIPQSASSVAAFKRSRVVIGDGASSIEVGRNATVYAPDGDVLIGAPSGAGTLVADPADGTSPRVFVDGGVLIDVAGLKDVVIPASRNTILIDPVKGNELRDTPGYRDSFLNGATVAVDPRLSGVRDDGVAWVGSPLIEAASYYAQVGVTVSELMTKGGNIAIGVPSFSGSGAAALAPDIVVKPTAAFDISGGWVRYAGGTIQTSRLITPGGEVIDIGAADPNGSYVGLVTPFQAQQTRYGLTESYGNPVLAGTHYEAGYVEGRDAGSLTLKGSAIAFDGTLYGQAYAGSRQLVDAAPGTASGTAYGDLRRLQAAPSELPSGGYLNVQALGISSVDGTVTGGGDIRVGAAGSITPLSGDLAFGGSTSVGADGMLVEHARDPASFLPEERRDAILLSADALDGAGLGQVSLRTSGTVTIDRGAALDVAAGGIVTVDAGRSISVAGAIRAPGGSIALTTYETIDGSLFAAEPARTGAFDIIIDGTLSAAGRWINDYGAATGAQLGGAYTDGGSVALTVAPRVSTPKANGKGSADVSGSVVIDDGALVDVSGGGYVDYAGTIDTSARGGDLSLVNQTNYFQISPTPILGLESRGNVPGFRVSGNPGLDYALNPDVIAGRVSIADGTIRANGFAGGGTFTLDTPAIAFGNAPARSGTALPLGFFARTGFADYAITSYGTALVANAFDNGLGGYNAVLATQTLTVRDGETLNLTQSRFSPLLDATQTVALQSMASGGSLYSVLTPTSGGDAYDRLGIGLALGGLVELDVARGGRVTGDAGSSLTVAKLWNAGRIRLVGGTITQNELLPDLYIGALGVHGLDTAFTSDADGTVHESAANAAGVRDGGGRLLTNAELALRPLYLLGALDADEGVRLSPGSVTDLSGASLRNPREARPSGAPTPVIGGTILAGGTLETLAAYTGTGDLFARPAFGEGAFNNTLISVTGSRAAELLNAQAGAVIDISGASDSYSQAVANGGYVQQPVWSSGGRLALGNGGTLTGSVVHAEGGATAAEGGTLEMLDPVLSASDLAGDGRDHLSTRWFEHSGFDDFTAFGTLSGDGDVRLDVRNAFTVASRRYDGVLDDIGRFVPVIASTGLLDVRANHILLDGLLQSSSTPALGSTGGGAVSFRANSIDVRGAVVFDRSVAALSLASAGDLRLIGARPYQQVLGLDASQVQNSLGGQLLAGGDVKITAAQVYPTTGSSFLIASADGDATLTIARATGAAAATPYSAGGDLLIQAAHIVQNGTVRVPIGTLTIGGAAATPYAPATRSVSLGGGSITSVSANGLSIPYGTTTDQTEYFFTPTSADALTAPPAALLHIAGADVALDSGATIDISGGGDVYAYEFVPGTGGSRDVLDRFASDPYSSDGGFQYPDGRQVYAIVPGLSKADAAAYDPLYSANYASLYGADAGRSVHLDATPGLAAGWYTLLPAKYAMLPGGMRVVEQVGTAAFAGGGGTLRDGTTITTGYYGVAGTGIHDATLRSFSVQGQSVFRQYSDIVLTSASTTFSDRATRDGVAVPRLPGDAARLVLEPGQALSLDATLLTAAAGGGRGARVDIAGDAFAIVAAATGAEPAGAIVLTADEIGTLHADSLLIGGVRSDNADGSTNLAVTAHDITIANDAAHPLAAPELLLAIDGDGSTLDIADGAAIRASGTLADTATGDYIVTGTTGGQTADGAVLRIANGAERLLTRTTPLGVATAPSLRIGAAAISGTAVLADSSGDAAIAAAATIEATDVALSASAIAFGSDPGQSGLVIAPALQARLDGAERLTLRTPGAIAFESGGYTFGDLVLDTPGLRGIAPAGEGPAVVTVTAGDVRLANSAGTGAACGQDCGGGALAIVAKSLEFGSGVVHGDGFGGGVKLTASYGISYGGRGGFDAGSGALSIRTPFIADAAVAIVPDATTILPSLSLASTGVVTIAAQAGATATAPAGTPGAALAVSGASIAIADSDLRATAGKLSLAAPGDIILTGSASLATPGYAKSFGDAADPYTVSAPGGTLSLTSAAGNISLGAGTLLTVGGGAGAAGSVRLLADAGDIAFGGTIDATAPEGAGGLTVDTGGSFDVAGFAAAQHGFTGSIDIRSGSGDLVLNAGQTIDATALRLVADGGGVDVAGTIDTSGEAGGDVALYGETGVHLASAALIDAHADGHSDTDARPASGGDVTFGAGDTGSVTVDGGATIDVGARRAGNRLVRLTRNGQTYYSFVEADSGGTLTLRARDIVQAGPDTANVGFAGTVTGARAITLQAYRRFDLAALAGDDRFTGVAIVDGTAVLDTGATTAGRINVLADDGSGTIPRFVRDFDVSGAYAGLGTLVQDPAFSARPEIELAYEGNVRLASNWNFGAGTVDTAAALAAGDLRASDALPGRVVVVAGREADLLERFTDMTYRVGGAIDGAPGTLTIRAGGDVTIAGVVSDGFFNFRDQTDPAYLTKVVGGDNSLYEPSVVSSCLPNTCSNVPDFALNRNGAARILVELTQFGDVRVGGGTVAPAPLPDDIPFSAAANTAAAAGGDAPGGAALFPVLADGGHAASWSYTLVAGATASADPLRVDPESSANLAIVGSRSYAYGGSNASYADGLLLTVNSKYVTLSELLETIRSYFPRTRSTANTVIALPAGNSTLAKFLRTRVRAFVAAHPTEAKVSGTPVVPTALNTTVELADSFLTSIENELAAIVEDPSSGALPKLTGGGQTVATVRNYVRTGTGDIRLAAAGAVDLRDGATIRYTNGIGAASTASAGYQLGGSAVYTAGYATAPAAASAVDPVSGEVRTLDASTLALGATSSADIARYLYGTRGQAALGGILVDDPVYAQGGGDVSVQAGGDVLGRRDASLEQRLKPSGDYDFSSFIGAADQPWRVGSVGDVTNLRIAPQLFTSGIGALGGGSVSVTAGGDISDLTVTALTSATTAEVAASAAAPATRALWTMGGGDVALAAVGDILGGRVDVGRGAATVTAGGAIAPAAALVNAPDGIAADNALRLRLGDATIAAAADGMLRLAGIAALGASRPASDATAALDSRGFYSADAAISLRANSDVTIDNRGDDVTIATSRTGVPRTAVYPGTLEAVSLVGDLAISPDPADSGSAAVVDLVPSPSGQLRLLAGGSIAPVTIVMDDRDFGQLPGYFSAFAATSQGPLLAGQDYGFPAVLPDTPTAGRVALHNAAITHLGDAEPVRIAAGGDITSMILSTPKQARISAGHDIADMMFFGQNLASGDITRITAGRDIVATTRLIRAVLRDGSLGDPLSALQGNSFVIGGPGAFMLEAGRDAGPFLNSATADPQRPGGGTIGAQGTVSYGGGIRSIGNEDNPALAATGASLVVQFGVAKGASYDALREIYVDPANVAALPDELFVQVADANGNPVADRSRPIYGPVLIAWMKANAPDALLAVAGTADVDYEQAYAAFATLSPLRQRVFLVEKVYFNELQQTSIPGGPSYLKYSRGYRAVNTLFPASLGYTANSLDGGAAGAARTVATGNLDLRLATIQTARGGDIDILGPGGRILAGSTVSTADQAARRSYDGARLYAGDRPTTLLGNGNPAIGFSQTAPAQIESIPTGFEGILTLRGGAIRAFVDEDLLLNQSRLFTQAGGDITLWSSNGDLNAGQGPKTSANFPPVAVRIDQDAFAEVDAVGGVSGAGIAAFQPAAGVPAPDVYLIAPRGTVDAGDAGVRVAGNLFIAAASVANADNFKVGGTSFGIPAAATVDAGAAAAANSASAAAQQLATAAASGSRTADALSRITVDVLGYGGGDDPCDNSGPKAADCPPGN